MKIIDLLNKIANGEEVPEKILYKYKHLEYDEEHYLTYDRHCECYYDEEGRPIPSLLADNLWNLNDEVEIIEEKKIPEKLKDILRVDDLIPPVDENMYKIWKQTIKNQNKINEICDYLKSKGE